MSGPFKKLLDSFVEGEATPGEMLRALRKREGYTLKKMEYLTGVKESNLSAIENDKIDMTKHYAELFAKALKVHPTAFLYPNGEFAAEQASQSALDLVLPKNLPRSELVKRLWAYIKKRDLVEFKKTNVSGKGLKKQTRETHHFKKTSAKVSAPKRKYKA